MEVVKQPLSRSLTVYAVGARYGCGILFNFVKEIFTKGPWRVFRSQPRVSSPAELNDPSLGTHGYLQLSDVKLHYVSNGREDQPLMLFLHGFPECWYSWRHQMKYFSKSYRTVAVDMRGFLDSDKPQEVSAYYIMKLVNDIKEVIPALGYKQCTLVAHDWGAAVAWAFANFYPEYLHRMVIINVGHHFAFAKHLATSKKQYQMSWYMFFFQLPYLPEFFLRSDDYRNLGAMMGEGSRRKIFTPRDIEVYKYAASRPGALTSSINYYRAGFRFKGPKYPTKDIRTPTLIIWGTKDRALDTELAQMSANYVNNCKLHYLEGVSHWVNEEKPSEVNQCIDQFLAESTIPRGVSKL